MIIIGCDLHTRMQQIAMLDTETGEVVEKRLEHENREAKRFYEGLKESALVGIESTGYTLWFAEMLAELGHELVVGEAGKIWRMEARKQKHDRRDAEHLLNLLMRGDFPKVWLPNAVERDVRVLVEHRHQLVELRTRAKNGRQAMALSYGLRRRGRLWSAAGQEELQKLPLSGNFHFGSGTRQTYTPTPPASTRSMAFSAPLASAWPVWVAAATSRRPRRQLLDIPPPSAASFNQVCFPLRSRLPRREWQRLDPAHHRPEQSPRHL